MSFDFTSAGQKVSIQAEYDRDASGGPFLEKPASIVLDVVIGQGDQYSGPSVVIRLNKPGLEWIVVELLRLMHAAIQIPDAESLGLHTHLVDPDSNEGEIALQVDLVSE